MKQLAKCLMLWLVLLLPGFAFAQIALVANTSAISGSDTSVTTSGINTSAATLIVVGITKPASFPAPTLSDLNTNTWVPLTEYTDGVSGGSVQLFYAQNPTVSAGHTFTITRGGSIYGGLNVLAFSGTLTSGVYDQENGAVDGGGPPSQPGSITPAANGALLVSAFGWVDNDETESVNSGFTISDSIIPTSGVTPGLATAYVIQTTAAGVNPTWSTSAGSGATAASMASFLAASGGSSSPVLKIMQMSAADPANDPVYEMPAMLARRTR